MRVISLTTLICDINIAQVFYQDYNHTVSDLGNSTGSNSISSKSKINKNMTTVSAPRFICWAYEESHLIFEDERYFPTKYGSEFGEDFDAKMKSISRWLFAVTSHMYYAHYLNLWVLGFASRGKQKRRDFSNFPFYFSFSIFSFIFFVFLNTFLGRLRCDAASGGKSSRKIDFLEK